MLARNNSRLYRKIWERLGQFAFSVKSSTSNLVHRKTGALVIVGTLSLALLAIPWGCSRSEPPGSDAYKENSNFTSSLRRGIGGEPGSLDPAQAIDTYSYEVLRDIYEGLTTETRDGSIVPGAASSWEISDSGKRYEFTIRHDAKWSDGSKLVANDFVHSWQRVVDPKNGSPVAELLRPIEFAAGIISGSLPPERLAAFAPSANKLVVELHQPTPYFPQLLTHSATFPFKTSIVRHGVSVQLLSNGPYQITKWIPGGQISARRNPFYWAADQALFDTTIYEPISNEDTEFSLYRTGQLDMTANVPLSALPIVEQLYSRDLFVEPFLGVYYYLFNLRQGPLRNSKSLRKALTLAIDRNLLRQTLLPFHQQPAYSFVPPGTKNYELQSWEWMTRPAESLRRESLELYRESGFSKSHPLTLRLLINSSPSLKRMAVAITSMWAETLGVRCEISEEEYRVFLESRKSPTDWDVIRLGWTADFNDASNFLETFRSGSPNNDSGYSNPKFDTLLDEAANSADPDKRKQILEYAERVLLADYPFAPIYFYSSKRLIRPKLTGVDRNPLNRIYTKHIRLRDHSTPQAQEIQE